MVEELEQQVSNADDPAPEAGSDVQSPEEIWNEINGIETGEQPEQAADPDPIDEEEEQAADPEAPEPEPEPEPKAEDTDSETPDKLREQIEKLTHQVNSERGRSRGLNRKYERTQSELREAKAELAALRSPDEDESEKEQLAKAREEYGDVLDPVLKKMDRADEANRRLAKVQEDRVKSLTQEASDLAREEADIFRSEHPKGFEYLKEHHAELRAWVDDQPKADRDAFRRNERTITDGAEAALLLSKFMAHKAAPTPENRPDPKTTSRRRRQLAGARTVRSSGSTPVTADAMPPDDDPEAIWNHITRKG